MKKIFKLIKDWLNKEENPEDIICPQCGYYCLGNGGFWCIDKPGLQ